MTTGGQRFGAAAALLSLAACGQPVSPSVQQAVCARPDEVVVFDAGPDELRSSAGFLHGGWLASAQTDIRTRLPFPTGSYRLEVWARTTPFDGQPGELELRLGPTQVARLPVPEGSVRRSAVTFEVGEAGWRDVSLVFTNDRIEGKRDRNVRVARVRITRTSRLSAPEGARKLYEGLKGANVVLISIDTLRADHLSLNGYARATSPNLDALAARGVSFTNAVASSHWTAPSHATLLTGLHPEEHGLVAYPSPGRMAPEVATLAEALADAGYETAAFTAAHFVSRRWGLDQGFHLWEEDRDGAAGRFGRGSAWLAARAKSDTPFFLFLHTYEVHEPYDPPAPWDGLFAPAPAADSALREPLSKRFADGWRPSPAELGSLVALYDGGIRYTDGELGRFLDGLDPETLVIVTSDHGEEFLDHGGISHGALYGELVRVPLVFGHPKLRLASDAVVDQVTGAVDLAPTILDLVGVAQHHGSGVSLVGALAGDCDAETRAWSSSEMFGGVRRSLLDGEFHFLEHDGVASLFSVATDRTEAAALLPEEVWLRAADAFSSQRSQVGAVEPVDQTEEEREALRALGYVQ